MFPIMRKFLEGEGYEILETHPGKQRGPDIVARKSGKELIIELKGDTKALDVDLGTAIWQLLRYLKDDSKDYALALTPSYERFVRAVKYPLDKLRIQVFMVSDKRVWVL